MCGITGFVQRRPGCDFPDEALDRMTDRLRHRGPDARGVWISRDGSVGLGHRRLAIQDLSPLGQQPMHSATGRYTLIFNGEIYNFRRLQAELRPLGHEFRGHSDTEVILAAFEQWGVIETLPRLWGMFSLAVWDAQGGSLTLVRDRFGVKPLHYGIVGNHLVFASELSPFTLVPGFARVVAPHALALYLRYGNVPSPHCIWAGIQKLPPGSFLTIRPASDEPPSPQPYWQLADVVAAGRRNPFTGSYEEAVQEIERLLRDAISLRMIADVPLGVFLSGGIDSSVVAALMQAQSSSPISSYTIGFREQLYDEGPAAGAVARHLGTNHTSLVADERHALDLIPKLGRIYDEPFADSSQVPTLLVSEMARRHVTVALSGDGGDETFGGYNRHVFTPGLWRKFGMIPSPARCGLAGLMDHNFWEIGVALTNKLLPADRQVAVPLEKLQKLSVLLRARNPANAHLLLSSFWPDPHAALVRPTVGPASAQPAWPEGLGFAEFMMYADTIQYLPDDVLTKVDRASMAFGLETREPLLDHRLVEFAWTLPLEFKVRSPLGKRPLRDILGRHVPPALTDRPKIGFGVPIDRWLRGALRDWADALLAPERLRADGFFNCSVVRLLWDEHQSNARNHHHRLWTILMFNLWLDEWR